MFARVALCVVATASFVAASSDQMAPWLAGEAITLAQSQQCKTFNADGTCQTSNDVPTGATAIPYTAGSYNGKDDLIMFEAFEGQNNCFVTSKKPRQPRSLSFCHKFNDESCCAPQMDAEITETFNFLTGTGLSCRIRGDIREDPLAQWFCMGCDPEQPKYVRPVGHDVITPDCAVVDDDEGGCGTSPSGDRGTTALMCRDWARTSFGSSSLFMFMYAALPTWCRSWFLLCTAGGFPRLLFLRVRFGASHCVLDGARRHFTSNQVWTQFLQARTTGLISAVYSNLHLAWTGPGLKSPAVIRTRVVMIW